jgi:hypothetical protein
LLGGIRLLSGILLLRRVGLLGGILLLELLGRDLGLDLAELGLAGVGGVDDAGADKEHEVHNGEDPATKASVAILVGLTSSFVTGEGMH